MMDYLFDLGASPTRPSRPASPSSRARTDSILNIATDPTARNDTPSVMRDGVRFVYDPNGSMQPELPSAPPQGVPSLSSAMVSPDAKEATRKKVMGQRDSYLANQRQNVENRRNEARMNPFPYGSPGRLAQFAELAGVQARGDQEMKQLMAQQQFDRPFRQEQADILRAKMGQERDLSMAELAQRDAASRRMHGLDAQRIAQERELAGERNRISLMDLVQRGEVTPALAAEMELRRRELELKEALQEAAFESNRHTGMLPPTFGLKPSPFIDPRLATDVPPVQQRPLVEPWSIRGVF